MKEYLVVFAQMLCVAWLLRNLSKAQGRLEDEGLGWFDIRLGGRAPRKPKSPPDSSSGGAAAPPAAGPGERRGPHA